MGHLPVIFLWIDSNINSWVSNDPFFFWQFLNFCHLDTLGKGTRSPVLSNWCGRNRILKISLAVGLIKGLSDLDCPVH